MKVLRYMILLAVLSGCSDSRDGPRVCRIEPAVFCEPYAKWEADMPQDAAAKLKRMSRAELRELSFSFGMGVRNEFGLWQENAVTAVFKRCGLDHPDYMSTPFTLGFIEYLNDRPADMCAMSKQFAPGPIPPPPRGGPPNNSFKGMPLRGTP